MNVFLIIVAAVLPSAFLLAFVIKKDKKPEPVTQLVKAFLWGMATCIPIAIIEYFLLIILFGSPEGPTNLAGTTTMAFFVAAVPEECVKLLALWIVLRKNPFFDEYYDGIVYAVCVGLGFATIENIGYVVGSENWTAVAFSRALLAVPGHYAFAILMGYYYSLYHFVDRSSSVKTRILLAPILAHGVYDSLAMSGSVEPLAGGVCFIVLIYFCVKLHKYAYAKITEMVEKDEFYSN